MVRGYLVSGVALATLFFVSSTACAQAAPAQQQQPPAQEAPKPEPPKAEEPFEPHSGQAGKDVVWVPTPQATVDAMLELTRVTASDHVIDLGSGDGITVITAAKKGATAVGVEFNPDMVALAKKRAAEAGVADKVTFIQGDLFEADLSKATVITLFLLPDINKRLRPKLLDLAPGTRIASNSFDMGDWKPDATKTSDPCSQWCNALYWMVPAKVGGTWTLGNQTLTLVQQYQVVEGTLGKAAITDGKLTGAEITFTAGGRTYTGKVEGSTIKGSNWTATLIAAAPAPAPAPAAQ
jgi:SAM-dependent methyltransferase